MSHPKSDQRGDHVASNEAAAQAVVGHHFHLSTGLIHRVEALLELVESDHRSSAEEARRELQAYLRSEIIPHARAEESVLYPAAAATPEGGLLVDGMLEEHSALLALDQELASAGSLVRAAAAARALAALFGTHLHKENNLVLPLLVDLPGVVLADLLAGMHDLLGERDGAERDGVERDRVKRDGAERDGAERDGVDEAAGGTASAGGCAGDGSCGCGGDRPAGASAQAPVLSVDTRLDVRDIPHDERHPLVLSTVAALAEGEAVVLVASHAPRPVLAEVGQRFGAAVEAQWLQSGPDTWQVRLERIHR